MYLRIENSLPIAALLLTGACNSVAPTTPVSITGYETFASEADVTSTLGGVALKLRENPETVSLSASSGTLKHDTGATTIDDGTYTLVDKDGPTAGGLLTDGISVMIVTPAQGFSNNYDYVRVYNQGYLDGATPYSVTGVYGVVTRSNDMPSSGSATYTGEAEGTFSDGTTQFDLDDGTSNVTANFSTGTVNVTMDGFKAVNRTTGASADVGFDGVSITNMRTSGNRFSGGTIATLKDGTRVQIVGTRQQQSALGRFFGLDRSKAPDEVGGIGYLKGADGSVSTIFLAD